MKRLGGKGSTARSAEQTAYGAFWYEFSDIGWNRAARVAATDRKLGLQATARLFALLNMAMSDAYVAGWDSKFHYDFWRPTTAIRAAATDGNPATAADASWESELVTPAGAGPPLDPQRARGTRPPRCWATCSATRPRSRCTSTSVADPERRPELPQLHRRGERERRLAGEAGLHFRFACNAGQALGRQVGAWVTTTALQPLKNLAARR